MSAAKSFRLILLYESMPPSLPAAQGLKDKGVEVNVVDSAASLIKALVNKQHDVIGMSVNHPSCNSLIKIIRDKMKLPIMVFGEDRTEQTMKKVQISNADFKINGTLTAYNAWMKIHNIYKEKMQEDYAQFSKDQKNAEEKADRQKNQGAIVVKGQAKKKSAHIQNKESSEVDNGVRLDQEESQSTHETFVSKGEENKKHSPTIEEEESRASNNVMESSGAKRGKGIKMPSELKEKEEAKTNQLATEEEVQVAPPKPKFNRRRGGKKKKRNGRLLGKARKPIQRGEEVEKKKPEEQNLGDVEAQAAELVTNSTMQNEQQDKNNGNVLDLRASEEAPNLDIQKGEEMTESGTFEDKPSAASEVHFRDYVEKASEGLSLIKGDEDVDFTLTKKVSVLPVENNTEVGYLIFCSESTGEVSTEEVASFKEKIEETAGIELLGELKMGDVFNIDIRDIDLHDWAQSSSKFHFLYQNQKEDNVLVCFISKEQVYPKMHKDEELNLYRIDLSEIPPLFPVNFCVYLYLKKNEKIIPYMNKGCSFTDNQLDRLNSNGFSSVYIKEEDIGAYQQFYVSKNVNNNMQAEEDSEGESLLSAA